MCVIARNTSLHSVMMYMDVSSPPLDEHLVFFARLRYSRTGLFLAEFCLYYANKAAVSAANAALAARPFKVVLSIDSDTLVWLTVVVLGMFSGRHCCANDPRCVL
jgi:hypothetical protein